MFLLLLWASKCYLPNKEWSTLSFWKKLFCCTCGFIPVECNPQFHHLQSEAAARRCSMKKGVIKNFEKLIGITFVRVSLLISLFIIKKRLRQRRFPQNFAKFVRTPFFTEHLRWLLLSSKRFDEPFRSVLRSLKNIYHGAFRCYYFPKKLHHRCSIESCIRLCLFIQFYHHLFWIIYIICFSSNIVLTICNF